VAPAVSIDSGGTREYKHQLILPFRPQMALLSERGSVMPRVVPSFALIPACLILVTGSLFDPGPLRAQSPADGRAVLARPEAEVVRWAQDRFRVDPRSEAAWPAAWQSLQRGSLDDFMARPGADFVRLFPGSAGGAAVVATWTRTERHRTPAVCRVEVRDAAGRPLGSFNAEPYRIRMWR
jgi:hypothetical protein